MHGSSLSWREFWGHSGYLILVALYSWPSWTALKHNCIHEVYKQLTLQDHFPNLLPYTERPICSVRPGRNRLIWMKFLHYGTRVAGKDGAADVVFLQRYR